MVGDHQEIQRRLDLHPGAVEGMYNRLASRIAVGHVRIRGEVVVGVGVEGVARVQVGITPQQLLVLGGGADRYDCQ